MALLKIYGGQALQVTLNEITAPVQVTYQALETPEPDTMAALADLQALTPHLSVAVAPAPPESAADRVTVKGSSSQALVFLGPPVGIELAALVSAIVVAGRGASGLLAETQAGLAALTHPAHLEIFTTPTWPHCAQAVSLAHKFAFESPLITAEAISAVALPDLAQHYRVLGTPHTVLNGRRHLKGRLGEEGLLAAIRGDYNEFGK